MDEARYFDALVAAKRRGKVSAGFLQRELGIGYQCACEIFEAMKMRERLVQGVSSFTWVWPSGEDER